MLLPFAGECHNVTSICWRVSQCYFHLLESVTMLLPFAGECHNVTSICWRVSQCYFHLLESVTMFLSFTFSVKRCNITCLSVECHSVTSYFVSVTVLLPIS